MNHGEDAAFRARVRRVDALIEEVDRFPDAAARETTHEIIRGILDYHGAGLARVLELVAGAGEAGQALLTRLADDELVSSLLLLYDLHPLGLEARVRQALDRLRPQARRHGGDVELLAVAGTAVRVRMEANGNGCHSSAASLRSLIEETVSGAAPELTSLEIEGAPPAAAAASFIPVEELTLSIRER